MAYTIVESYVSSSKYGLKCPYSMKPESFTVHNTANDASARNEISYMKSNNYEVSFHVAVDDKEVVIGIPFNRNAWHAGDGNGNGNRKSIGIEICYSKSGGSRFTEAEKNAAAYIASQLKVYGWGVDRVKKHQDWSGKYCPHRTLDNGWQRFLNMVSAELDKLNDKPATPPKQLYRVRKFWADSKSQLGAYKVLENAKKKADENKGYFVFDPNGKLVYPVQEKPAEPKTTLYRVRKVWSDVKSQLGAFKNLSNAKSLADKNAGYEVYDDKGKVVYDPAPDKKSNTEIAKEIIQGKCSDSRWTSWGTGQTRKNRLKIAGYNADAIQALVNKMMK